MTLPPRFAVLTWLFLLTAFPVLAATIRVPADQPTIQAGINAAVSGDTVLVAQGTYNGPGNRGINCAGKRLLLQSEAGPDLTRIDCEHRDQGFRFESGEDSTTVVAGFTISNGWPTYLGIAHYGGGILCIDSSPKIIDCVFSGNEGVDGGGGLCSIGGAPIVRECSFIQNHANYGGGVLASRASSIRLSECSFLMNRASEGRGAEGAALAFYGPGSMTIDRCTFASNEASRGTLYCRAGTVDVVRCTFSDNRTGISLYDNVLTMASTIIAFSTEWPAVRCEDGGTAALSCSDVFGNAGGDWVGCIEGQAGAQGNFSADPLFCDRDAGDFTLAANSPCLPGNHPGGADCGLVGALGEACPPASVDPTTWGAIKARFGRASERRH